MDKVIIIDGVDISECSYAITPKRQCPNKPMPYAKETSCIGCKEHNTKLNFCKNNPNCYYKQLKRLQAKYDDLHLNYAGCKTANTGLQELNQKLEQENERLKEENYQLQKDCQICENFIDFIPCKPIRDMDYDLQKVISQRDNYYQALQEIKGIAEDRTKTEDYLLGQEYTDLVDKIIAKINEVIGAEE